MTNDTTQSDRRITRRGAIAAGTTTVLGTGALAVLGSQDAAALEVGTFDVAGAERELGGAPTAAPIDAEVLVEGDADMSIDQIKVVLQVDYQRQTRELDEAAVFDVSGAYSESLSLSADLLDHDALTAADLEAAPGETVEESVRVGVVASAVVDGSIEAEDSAYAEASLIVHGSESVTVAVGGEATITIEGE